MSYRGRELTSGNYLKLDDIQSQFNGSTTTFNLTSGGSAFYPGSVFSLLVSLAGVVQEAISAYTINQNTITFASAPQASDDFFCVVLGTALGIGVPGEGTVSGSKLTEPFDYDDGMLYLDSASDRVGINSTAPRSSLDVRGNVIVAGVVTATTFSGSFTGALTGTATSTTNIPNLTGAITSSNTTTSLGSFTSANLATALTDETGSGSAVFSTSPTLVTPVLGAASATSIVVSSGSTFTNGPILVGTATSTGTANQRLQVTGGAYVSGNLGIGINNPSALLHLSGSVPTIKLQDNNNTGVSALQRIDAVHSTGGTQWFVGQNSTTTNDLYLYNVANANLLFGTNNTERLRITSSGNVGIGTTNPSDLLHVYGATPTIRLKGTGNNSAKVDLEGTYTTWSIENQYVNGATNDIFRIFNSELNQNALTISRGTNSVGIGTNNPARKLEIFDTAATVLQLNSTNTDGTSLRIQNSGTDKMYMGLAGDFITGQGSNVTDSAIRASGSLLFASGGGTERLRITSDGKVGIGGLISPGALLHLRDSQNTTQGAAQLKISKGVGSGVAPASTSRANCYIHLGSSEWGSGANGQYLIGFGYTDGETGTGIPAYIGFKETSVGGYTIGDLIFGTRDNSTGTNNATERLRIRSNGDLILGPYDAPGAYTSAANNVPYQIKVAPYGWQHHSELAAISMGNHSGSTGNDDGEIVFKTTQNAHSSTAGLVERLRIDSNGNVRIGATGSSGAQVALNKRTSSASEDSTTTNHQVLFIEPDGDAPAYYRRSIISQYKGFNQYSYWAIRYNGASYDYTGSLKCRITWSTMHASGAGFAEFSLAVRSGDSSGGPAPAGNVIQYGPVQYSGGWFYGWTVAPNFDVYYASYSEDKQFLVLRLNGWMNHNGGGYDGGVHETVDLQSWGNAFQGLYRI